jgi:hypothetical protein
MEFPAFYPIACKSRGHMVFATISLASPLCLACNSCNKYMKHELRQEQNSNPVSHYGKKKNSLKVQPQSSGSCLRKASKL